MEKTKLASFKLDKAIVNDIQKGYLKGTCYITFYNSEYNKDNIEPYYLGVLIENLSETLSFKLDLSMQRKEYLSISGDIVINHKTRKNLYIIDNPEKQIKFSMQ